MKIRYLLLLTAFVHSAGALEPGKTRLACQCSFNRYGLYLADAKGDNVKPLLAGTGSNYNASFSVDGHWIVFTSERSGTANLYRVHPDGSGLERLTQGNSFDDQGTLSPDGKTLAFASTRAGGFTNVWLLDIASGHLRNLTSSKSGNFRPAWSPDGQWLAFSSDRKAALLRYKLATGAQSWEWLQLTSVYVVRRDGSRLRRITPPGQIAGSPKWSPDGRRLTYYQVSDFEERHESRGRGHARIMVTDLETGAVHAVSTPSVFDESPQYLSDTDIAYASESREGGKVQLADTAGHLGAPIVLRNPSWSPDGSTVVFHRRENSDQPRGASLPSQNDHYELIGGPPFRSSQTVAFAPGSKQFFYSEGNSNNQLKTIGLAGTPGQTIFDIHDPRGRIKSLALSPDEHEIALEVERNWVAPDGSMNRERPPLPSQIFFVGADGSARHPPLGGDDSSGFPSYGPDGRQIVYRLQGRESGLRVASTQDGRIRVLTKGWDNFPAWSPHGDRIAFTRLENNFFEIYSIRPDGSDLKQLTHSRGTDSHPVWSPDGQWLAFVSGRYGFKDESFYIEAGQSYGEIFVMRYDGSDVRQVTDNRYEELVQAWLPD